MLLCIFVISFIIFILVWVILVHQVEQNFAVYEITTEYEMYDCVWNVLYE